MLERVYCFEGVCGVYPNKAKLVKLVYICVIWKDLNLINNYTLINTLCKGNELVLFDLSSHTVV